jgi:lipopolysaccharide assembly outer membrane protein LptD (OstA)
MRCWRAAASNPRDILRLTPAAAALLMTSRLLSCFVLVAATGAATASAQVPGYNSKQFRIEQIDAEHWRFTGQVELENEEVKGQKFYANVVDLFTTDNRVEASGNVVYETATARIAAERAVFFTRAGTGTFYTASGLASLGEKADKSMFGALEPDVYFYGEVLEKVGEDRYKIAKGGFTTCVQPTPRWELVTGSATINVGEYAVLRNAVMRVKDVPIFYLPIMYYPIQDDDRATGFLLPTYGRSNIQGQSISNAFFWAISRSQDLTVLHDWYTATGQGYGSEYRWMRSPTSAGNLRAYRLQQKAASVNGIDLPESRSLLLNGSITQDLPLRLKARARIDYSSNLTVNQLYSQDVFNATNGLSSWNGNVSGSWRFMNSSLTAQRTQQFFNASASRITGSLPSLTAGLSSRRLGPLPIYFGVQSEASQPIYIERDGDNEIDRSMARFDLTPTVRMPISGLSFINVNLNAAYRTTWYSESLDENRNQVDVDYTRRYADLRAEILGPVFSRVYTPNNFMADRLKHVIEPSFTVQRITTIDGEDRVATLGSSFDRVVGGVTRITYGLTNRVLVRKASKTPTASPLSSAPRDLLTASLSQSYYTNKRASQFDPTYQSSYVDLGGGRPPSNYSPVSLNVRSQLSTQVAATYRMEYDASESKVLSMSTGGDYGAANRQVSLAWSRSLSSFFPTNTLNGSTRLVVMAGRLGASYAMYWDIKQERLVQQRMTAFFNAQCCGLVVEYQELGIGSFAAASPLKIRRFNLGFTLAGLGTFSNFFGNFGGSSY